MSGSRECAICSGRFNGRRSLKLSPRATSGRKSGSRTPGSTSRTSHPAKALAPSPPIILIDRERAWAASKEVVLEDRVEGPHHVPLSHRDTFFSVMAVGTNTHFANTVARPRQFGCDFRIHAKTLLAQLNVSDNRTAERIISGSYVSELRIRAHV